ncbi:Sau3AI family type II restriction endonuclease [Marinicella gelatinilytica]|uniref:Sau3AI family type II restriction endonuclease n=1 Tax=Marinicella gelatinilytica TaxID=2996017 RepID=UPI002260A473|nr:Sau3AI family type II restriction endonuclease [Marinicella gelatinilytica]MCX7544156.1 Sau3AI family type II restriction endonuclease [Marinicella gelatinilytica]
MNKRIKFDIYSAESIVNFAKNLKNQTLRQACDEDIEKHGYKGKGNYGQVLEKFYFGYEPNSNSEPDFPEAGIELKTSPLKTLKNGSIKSKERLVLNIINYLEVHKEDFDNSSFWNKNAHLLLVFYLHNKEQDFLDYIIKLVDQWQYPADDLKIIKNDWEKIKYKIESGEAHEISEGDTFYLGACTKGATAAKSLREQPFSKIKAKQRAYSLKQGYVNHIIANIAKEETAVYGKIIKQPEILDTFESIEDVVISKFKRFYGKSFEQIENELGLDLSKKPKHYFANLTNAILGIELGKKIEEFEKANIQVKTIRLKENNLPDQNISFPAFKYEELIKSDWEESEFKNILESKFFFVFYQFRGKKLILNKVKFWNMSYSDIHEAKKVWDAVVKRLERGEIVKKITPKGIRKTFFPSSKDNRISHVRPHANNAADTYKLPVADKLTGLTEYTKYSFWLNATYVKDEIYLK